MGLTELMVLLLSVASLPSLSNSQSWGLNDGGMKHYCEDENFEATCGKDEVVLVHAALYGRMHRSQCLQGQRDDPSCKLDVLDYLDTRCSGRHSCVVKVSSILHEYPPCLKVYRGYLEAEYSCVKVSTAPKLRCSTSKTVQTTQYPEGYLASIITEETTCGSLDCPWTITVPSGQAIRIHLLDFAASERDESLFVNNIPLVCHVLAVVRENEIGASDTVCGSITRNSPVYTSVTSSVEIRIRPSSQKQNQDGYFLLKYEAVGCPELPPPVDGWMEKRDDGVLLGCNGSDDSWRLKCEGNRWTGMVDRNCSFGEASIAASKASNSIIGILTGSEWASIIIILTIAVTLGLTIFLVGLVYLRRRGREGLYRQQATARLDRQSVPDYYATQNQDNVTIDSGYGNGGNKALPPGDAFSCQENDYFRTWQMQRHTSLGTASSVAPPGSYDTMENNKKRTVEHIYESPKFDRKDNAQGQPEREEGTNVQYYELDPEAVDGGNYPG